MIEPILLGGGKRIFPDDGTARPMQLVKCVTAGTGVRSARTTRRRERVGQSADLLHPTARPPGRVPR